VVFLEREVAEGVSIAIALAAVAALLGIVFFTVFLGNGVKEGAGGALTDIRDEISVNFVKALESGELDNEMPAATAYNIIKTYDKAIIGVGSGLDGSVSNPMIEEPTLGNHLTGRVQLEVHDVDGAFIVFIHNEDCNWKVGNHAHNDGVAGNCKVAGFDSLKTKYSITTSWTC
jgi:hypothetical protein